MSPRCLDNRAFLLIETLVTLMVISIVMGIGLRFLVPMLHIQTRTTERVEMQQRAELLMEALRRDFSRTTPQAVSFSEFQGQKLLAIHLPSDVQSDGRVVWSSNLILYRWDANAHRMTRSLWKDDGGTVKTSGPTQLTSEQLKLIARCTTPSTIVPWVESFEMDWENASTAGFPVELKAVLKSPRGERRTFRRTFTGRLPLL